MKRHLLPVSRRATVVLVAFLLWILLRFGYDQLVWHRRETTLDSLVEGEYRVIRVVDWRTLLLTPVEAARHAERRAVPSDDVARRARVCLIGISSPGGSTVGPSAVPPIQPRWPDAATSTTRRFVAGGTVRLRLDRRRIDQARVFLAYVFVGDCMLNEELVRQGLARVDVQPRDSARMVSRLRKAELEARDQRKGMWSEPAAR